MKMSAAIRRYINSIGVTGTVLPLQHLLDYMIPDGSDVGITAQADATQANATVLDATTMWHEVVTVAGANDSVVLPPARVGEIHFIANQHATNAIQVFAPTPDTINAVATGTGVAQAALTGTLYVCLVDGNYCSF
jgi:hypothetical protein